MGRPLGPSGGLPGGGGTGLPEGLRGGRAGRWPATCEGRCADPGGDPGRGEARGCAGRWPIDDAGGRGGSGRVPAGGPAAGAAAGAVEAGSGPAGGAGATGGSAGRAPVATSRAGAPVPRLVTSRGTGSDSSAEAPPGTGRRGGAFFATTGAGGSSGWTGRRNPCASALLRTRSAWASSMEDEWLFTPIPSAKARSRASLFVRPSSRASS